MARVLALALQPSLQGFSIRLSLYTLILSQWKIDQVMQRRSAPTSVAPLSVQVDSLTATSPNGHWPWPPSLFGLRITLPTCFRVSLQVYERGILKVTLRSRGVISRR